VTLQAQSWRPETEKDFIESLRARYEDEGFTFTAPPDVEMLPDFLGSYIPDALAQKPGRNVVIGVRRRRSPSTERALRDIRRLFEGHADWQFHVAFMGADPLQSATFPSAEPETIRSRAKEVRILITQGHLRPAFLMAWSLLEAALRALEGEATDRPRTPGTVVQTLAMNGYIEPEMEQRMHALISLRNQIVHGDLTAEPATVDVELVLSAIEETLSAAHVRRNSRH
jgi:uncharacterized protein YutE (UPF0331/DUF86 family)